jgi:hypothetical protein
MKVWQRPEEPIAPPRNSKPLEEQESDRWLEGYRGACEVKQACPTTLVVHVAAREGDIQEWCGDARRREPHQRAEVIIRATCHRRLGPGSRAAVCMGRDAAGTILGDTHHRTRPPA